MNVIVKIGNTCWKHHKLVRKRSQLIDFWRKVHMKTRMFFQPLSLLRVFVSRIVVANQVQLFVFCRFPIYLFKKLQPFHMSMTLLALTDDSTIKHMQREWFRSPNPKILLRVDFCPVVQLFNNEIIGSSHAHIAFWDS